MNSPSPFPPLPLASVLRQVGPTLILGAGIVGGTAWSLASGTQMTGTPPFLAAQGALMLAAALVAARGVPRWSYPWLAFGIGGAHYLLRFFLLPASLPEGETPSVALIAITTVAGLVLSMLLAALIAGRRWGDAAVFMALFLVATGFGLPSLRQPAEGAIPSVEALRLVVLACQTVLVAAAIIAWNRRSIPPALGLLTSFLVLTPLVLGLLLPLSQTELPADYSLLWLLVDFGRLYLVVAIFTFAAGAVRRVLTGQGILTGRTPSSGSA